MIRTARRALFVVALLSAIGLVMLVIGVFALDIWLKTADIKPAAQWAVSRMSGGRATFGQISADLASGVHFKKFRLVTGAGATVEVGAFDADFDLTSLLGAKLLVDSVTVKGLRVTLAPTPEKSADQPAPAEGGSAISGVGFFSSPVRVALGALRVEGIEIRAPGAQSTIWIKGVAVTGAGSAGPDGAEGKISIFNQPGAALGFSGGAGSFKAAPEIGITIKITQPGVAYITGSVGLAKADYPPAWKMEKMAPHAKLKLMTRLDGNLNTVGSASISLRDGTALSANGWWRKRGKFREYGASIKRLSMEINRLFGLLNLEGYRGVGLVDISPISVKGLVTAGDLSKARHLISGVAHARFKRISGPAFSASKGASLDVDIAGVDIDEGKVKGKLVARLNVPSLAAGGAEFDKISISAQMGTESSSPVSDGVIYTSISVGQARKGKLTLPGGAIVNSTLVGDFATGNLRLVKADCLFPSSDSRLKIYGGLEGYGRKKIRLSVDITGMMDKLMEIAPLNKKVFKPSGGSLRIKISANGALGDDFRKPALSFGLDADLKDLKGTFPAGGKIEKANIGLSVEGNLAPDFSITSFESKLNAESKSAQLEDVRVRGVKVALEASSPSLPKGALDAKLTMSADTLALAHGEPAPANVRIEAGINRATGSYRVNKGSVNIKGLASVRANGSFEKQNRAFVIDADIRELNLTALGKIIPSRLKKPYHIKTVAGRLEGTVKADGVAPKNFSALKYPFGLNSDISLRLANGALETDDGKISAHGLTANLSAGISGHKAWAKGETRAESAVFTRWLGAGPVDPSLEFDLQLVEDSRLVVNRFVFDVAELGLVETMEGYVSGAPLLPIVTGKAGKPARWLKRIDGRLENYVTLSLEKSRRFMSGMEVFGGVDTFVSVRADSGKGISISGESEFDNLSVSNGGKRIIDNLNGKLPFSKTLVYANENSPDKQESAEKAGARDTTFYEDIRGQSPERDSFSVDFVQAGPVQLADTVFDLFFRETGFGADYFRTKLLEGGLTGSARVASGKDGYRFRAGGVFAGVDLGELLRSDLGLTGEQAQVDGAVSIGISFSHGAQGQATDVAGVDASIHLSRIGARALDRLLRFLDPRESSPAIMNTRTVLKYATPARVDMEARHGNLSLSVDLKYSPILGGKTVTMPVISRFPIHSLVNFGVIKAYLGKLGAVQSAMRAVSASAIVFDENGGMRLR